MFFGMCFRGFRTPAAGSILFIFRNEHKTFKRPHTTAARTSTGGCQGRKSAPSRGLPQKPEPFGIPLSDLAEARTMDHATLVTISHLQASRYNIVASQLLLIYDTILCASREYKYIWRARWSFGKALYILIRYAPLIINSLSTFTSYRLGADPPPRYCRTMSLMETYVGVIELGLFQTTVAIRTYALCRDLWWAKSFLVFTIVGTMGGFFALNYIRKNT